MSANKKYYYLKLKDNFFNGPEIVALEGLRDGHLYSNILLKMYLLSLENDGRLMVKGKIPYDLNLLASITRHQVGTVQRAIEAMKELELIDILDNGAIYMLDIQCLIGKSSSEADRVKQLRKRRNDEKSLLSWGGVQMYDIRTPEIELELEKEKQTREEETSVSHDSETNDFCFSSTSIFEATNDHELIAEIVDVWTTKAKAKGLLAIKREVKKQAVHAARAIRDGDITKEQLYKAIDNLMEHKDFKLTWGLKAVVNNLSMLLNANKIGNDEHVRDKPTTKEELSKRSGVKIKDLEEITEEEKEDNKDYMQKLLEAMRNDPK